MKRFTYQCSSNQPGCVCVPTRDVLRVQHALGEPDYTGFACTVITSDTEIPPETLSTPETKVTRIDKLENSHALLANLQEQYGDVIDAGFSEYFWIMTGQDLNTFLAEIDECESRTRPLCPA